MGKWRAYALRSLRNIMVQLAVVLTALGPRRTRRVPMTSSERLTFQFFVLSVHVYSRCIKALPRHRVAFTVVDHGHGHHTRFRREHRTRPFYETNMNAACRSVA